MANVATRLFTLLMLLQRQPNQKAACLAAELGISISVRSLHRYMGMLEEMGIPVYAERGPHGGFSLVRLLFTPQGAEVARGQAYYWSSFEAQPDGGLVVTFPAYDVEYAAATALSYGALVQVLEPESLRRLVAERARAVAGLYAEENVTIP